MASASSSPSTATCRGCPEKSEKISFRAGGSGHFGTGGEGLQRVPAVSPRNAMRFLCHPKFCVVLGLPPCLAGALSMAAIFALVTCLALQLQMFTACAVVLPDGGSSALQGQLLQQQDLGAEAEALRWELRNATAELRALLLGLREQHRKSDQVALTKDQVREVLARERETLVQRLREALAAESSDAQAFVVQLHCCPEYSDKGHLIEAVGSAARHQVAGQRQKQGKVWPYKRNPRLLLFCPGVEVHQHLPGLEWALAERRSVFVRLVPLLPLLGLLRSWRFPWVSRAPLRPRLPRMLVSVFPTVLVHCW
mmetsp:Transcript_67554/g.218332  ORF Transcript_67554/g.218332 Transcript_67554/m.218332 type:complete len:310 (-) Transcript_67554:307-1236(-)